MYIHVRICVTLCAQCFYWRAAASAFAGKPDVLQPTACALQLLPQNNRSTSSWEGMCDNISRKMILVDLRPLLWSQHGLWAQMVGLPFEECLVLEHCLRLRIRFAEHDIMLHAPWVGHLVCGHGYTNLRAGRDVVNWLLWRHCGCWQRCWVSPEVGDWLLWRQWHCW